MLRTLLESNAPRQRRRGSAAASIAIHTLIVGGAIVATASAKSASPTGPRTVEEPAIFTRPVRQPEPSPAEKSRSATGRRNESWTRLPRRAVPSIPDFAVPSPNHAPVDIDPGKLLWTDTVAGDRGGEPRWGGDVGALGPIGDEPATLATVEQPAALLAAPRPRYPEMLRAAGVTGRVVVRLVVDTAGRVEPASVVVREASHELFFQAVRTALPSLRFMPARVGGRKVRMLVDLPFEFRLNE